MERNGNEMEINEFQQNLIKLNCLQRNECVCVCVVVAWSEVCLYMQYVADIDIVITAAKVNWSIDDQMIV